MISICCEFQRTMATNSTRPSSSVSHITYPDADSTQPVSLSSSNKNNANTDIDSEEEEKRLWLGNLDPKLTEFHLLKLVQKYGTIDHFDFLFHRSGPNIGLPRGYAFVEFQDRKSAEDCMTRLDGKKILDRHMVIRWAHQAVKDYPDEQTKLKSKLPALAVQESEGSSGALVNKEKAILAIEAKLRAMEREKEQQNFNFTNNKPTSSKCLNGSRSGGLSKTSSSYKQPTQPQQRQYVHKPYDRNQRRKPYSR